ncbi:hypothetical protein CRUP_020100, partial [Coryphaenoides rupestris]
MDYRRSRDSWAPVTGMPPSNLAFYLIVSLSTISLVFLVTIIILAAVKCYKDRETIGGYNLSPLACCCRCCGGGGVGGFQAEPPPEVFKKSNLNMQISTAAKVPTNCMEVNGNGSLSQSYCYKVCLTPESAKSDFMFLKPCSPSSTPRNNEAKSADNSWNAQGRSASVNNGTTTPNETTPSYVNYTGVANMVLTTQACTASWVDVQSELSYFVQQKRTTNFSKPSLKQPNTDWTLTKNQNSNSIKSYNSINMDGTLMRKAMHADPENYVASMAPGQYWTWGNHMRGGGKDYKMSSTSTAAAASSASTASTAVPA